MTVLEDKWERSWLCLRPPEIKGLITSAIRIYSLSQVDTIPKKEEVQENETQRSLSFRWHQLGSLALGAKDCSLSPQFCFLVGNLWGPGVIRQVPGQASGVMVSGYWEGLWKCRKRHGSWGMGFCPLCSSCFFPRKVVLFQRLRICLS